MIIPSKHNGYSPDGRRLLFLGGGGGQPTQTTSNVNQSNIPEYARPYVETMLGATQKQLFQGTPTGDGGFNITGFQPYKAYGGTYDPISGKQTGYDAGKGIAGFQPLQEAAQRGVAGLQVPGQFAQGAQGSMDVAGQANVGGFQNQVGGYMSPYMQNVTDIQKREAARQSGMQGVQQQSQAASAGAFGGSRDAIMRAERERNLGQQMGDIQAQGSQAAFQSAQQQYNQNLQNQLAGYGQAASLAGQGLQAQQGIYGLQNQMGAQQQSLEQQKLNQAMQDYSNAQQYPLMQLGTMSNMIRGLPMQASTTQQYQAQANPITQGIGMAGSAASLYNAYGKGAEGGLPSEFKYASGGITSVPRYDVGGSVQSQLMDMDDQSLAREAKESPSPEIKRMAQAILRQRQAGMNRESVPQPQPDASNVDYNANYAGGGIIAFQKGETVPRTPIVSGLEDDLLSGTNELDTQLRQRAALRAASAVDNRTPRNPAAYLPEVQPSPYADNENLSLSERMENTRNRIRSRTDPTFTPPEAAASIAPAADTAPAPTGIASVRRSSREAELAAARDYQAPPASAGIASVRRSPRGAELAAARNYKAPQAEPVAAAQPEPAAATQPKPAAPAQPVPRPAPAAPAAPKTGIATVPQTVPPATAAAPEVDPLADAQAEVNRAREEGKKSIADRVTENAEARKALGLDKNEAQAEYMKNAMAQKADIKAEAERNKHLRLAEFFASWGSTPGNTLVAGMTALKAKIPDMISDVKDQRKALGEADKVLYELGQANRKEKLGYLDEAAKQKEEAAKIAMQLNVNLSTARAGLAGNQITRKGMIESARIQQETSMYTADSSAATQRFVAKLQDKTREEAVAGRLSGQQMNSLLHATTELGNLPAKLERARAGNKEYEAAVRAESMLKAQLTQEPTNKELLVELTKAQDKLGGYRKSDAEIINRAQAQVDALAKKAFGQDFTAFSATSSTSDPLGLRK
jgi:hypothetical protein